MIKRMSGYSLVELLVLVAVVAIAGAIAIPQLSVFALNTANATAAADLRNAESAEKTFFSDWGVYASSAYGGVPGVGSVMRSYMNSTGQIWAFGISSTAPRATIPAPGFQIGISQGVSLVIMTSANGGSYTIASKNASGDRCFGMDSDAKEIFWINGPIGSMLESASAPYPTPGVNDFIVNGLGIAGTGPCYGSPAPGMGQITWAAL